MTPSALPSELDDDAHSHSERQQLQKEHSGDLEAHFLHVGHPCPCYPGHIQSGFILSWEEKCLCSVAVAGIS